MRIAVFAALLLAACTQEQVAPRPVTNPTELYFGVTLNHHAINLSTVAPYDTIRLVAIARNALGQPYPHPSRIVYASNDLAHVQINATGFVTAVAPVFGAVITAADTIGNVVHIDTAIVNVSDTTPAPVLTTFSIHPIPPDSAKWAAGYIPGVLAARALDASGNPIPNLTVDYEVSDTSEAIIDRQTGVFTGSLPGHVTFYATTTAYGITKADTLPFAFGYPIVGQVNEDSTGAFFPSEWIIGTGGSIVWLPGFRFSHPPDTLDVVFDDSTQVAEDTLFQCRCGTGNIPAFADSIGPDGYIASVAFRARSFPKPGTYTYHSHFTHATGKIIVTSSVTPPTGAMRVSRP